ncbi:HlyC/CorC family transporter [Natronococcus sp. JC468]|uniref:hemolysin family protein n=1 Tax=Natronococcus sp. JC468 TaxID=1961921 RepID=UPI00143B520C|nr:hemolysin family protein [Natronococcus sp. JC468]NKE34652.1 HlyC/CorC family transporter [Natronococcus sp. JC468]
MVDLAFSLARIVGALLLVALNGFFVAAEFAYVRVRATAVESLAAEGRRGAATLQEAMDNLDDYLAVTQLGITIASLGLGWLGEPAIAALIEPVAAQVLPESLVHLVAFAIGFSVITFLHVVFGELAPKTISIAQAERVALAVSVPMKLFYYLFVPGIVVFNGTANAFTRLLGVPPASETDETLTEEELRMALSRAGEEGHVAGEEVRMVESVFELDDIAVREIMVPRPDIRSVSADLSLPELRRVIVDAGHTRYPVVAADDPDEVVGLVDAKDVIRADQTLEGERTAAVTAGDLAREMPVVPETTAVGDLLSELQDEQAQMAAVIDEWGVLEGIVAVEDVVEVVVGDIRDRFDVAAREPSIDRNGRAGGLLVDGGVTLSALNDELGSAFDHDAIETVGGLVLDRLGRPPETGDRVAVDGYDLEVAAVDGMRISSVIVRESADEATRE